jgi:hypothetical protein
VRSDRVLTLWLIGLLLAAPNAGAQAGSAELTGLVRDQHGGTVPGAVVSVVRTGTNLVRTAVTSASGVYTAAGLVPGEYRVRVELSGFRPLVRTGVRLETGEVARLDLILTVGNLAEALTVTADASVLQTARATLGQIIGQDRIVNLPLNGRTFVSLIALAPGVALPPGLQFPRINGGRPRSNEYLYDGISVLQPEPGQVAFFPVIDAIQEFTVESNSPPAEFGRFNGGVINLATRSGSNTPHGTAFEFLRHESLNARNFFASTDPVKSRFRRQQFGGVFGGPLRRDRTFFFADYQGQRQTVGRTVISTVPTILQRQGMFTEAIGGRVPIIYDPATTITAGSTTTRSPFANGAIPLDRMDAVARGLLERYPLPTAAGTVNNYRRVGDEIADQDQFDVRMDHRLSSAAQAFARLSHFRETFAPVTPLPDGSGMTSGTLGRQRTSAWAFASSYQRTLSNRVFNELRIGDTRRAISRSATVLGGPAAAAGPLPGLPTGGRFQDTLPTFLVTGYQQLGSPPNTATDFSTSVTQIVDALTWVRGRHTVKLGGDLRWERLDGVQPPSPTGSFLFTSLFTDLPGVPGTGSPLASFLLGQVQTFSIDVQQAAIRNRAHIEEYFVQDDWKLNDRVTVNGGVRYTLNFPSTETNDQVAVFNTESRQLEYLGRDGHPRAARRLHALNFGPRLGIVVQLGDRLVARTGYGLVWIEQAGITTPFTTPHFPFVQTISERSLDNIVPAFALADGPTVAPIPLTPDAGLGQGVFAVDRDLGSGYVQQWNAALQRAISSDTTVEVAYVGSRITRVGIPDTNINQLTVDQLRLGASLLQRVPNPYVGVIPRSSSLGDPTIPLAQLLKPFPQYTTVSFYRNNVGTTEYHGLAARLEQRLHRGLSFLVSYTRSRLMDDASSVFDASILTGPIANVPVADSFNRTLERDYSTGDIPHVVVSSVVWELPVGAGRRMRPRGWLGRVASDWLLAGVVTLQSGIPVAVTQSTNFNAFAGFGAQRPNRAGNPQLPSGDRSVRRWFDTNAFATAPQFTIGSSSRNPVRGPAYRNVDAALIRRVPIGSKGPALEARLEVFNALNTPPLGNPNGSFGTAAFGSITTAGDPRIVQLAMKLVF